MKTELVVKLGSTAVVLLLGALSAACTGPGVRNRGHSQTVATASIKCEGCQTTPNWVLGDRDPAGKGVPGMSVAGKRHACENCTGTITNEKGRVKDTMARSNACASLLCCK